MGDVLLEIVGFEPSNRNEFARLARSEDLIVDSFYAEEDFLEGMGFDRPQLCRVSVAPTRRASGGGVG